MTTATTSTTSGLFSDGPRFLRLALRADAIVTGANGLLYLALAAPLKDLLGLDTTTGRELGAFLVVYAVAVWAISMSAHPKRLAVTAVVEANALWTILSITTAIVGWFSLTTAGTVWTLLQAIVVAAFGTLQYTALRRTR
ncbi:hypothetical protein [Actinomadura harenae]|nr:hypothetical protein [Actinomadura harenae]